MGFAKTKTYKNISYVMHINVHNSEEKIHSGSG